MSTSDVEVMVLQRILLVVLVLFVLWRLLVAYGRRLGRTGHGADSYSRFSPRDRRRRRDWAAGSEQRPDELVRCGHCGTYVPSRRALGSGTGAVFCSSECRDRHGAPAEHGR